VELKNNKKTWWIIGLSVLVVLLAVTLAPQEVKLLLFTLITDF
jgi:hypothetical protein